MNSNNHVSQDCNGFGGKNETFFIESKLQLMFSLFCGYHDEVEIQCRARNNIIKNYKNGN